MKKTKITFGKLSGISLGGCAAAVVAASGDAVVAASADAEVAVSGAAAADVVDADGSTSLKDPVGTFGTFSKQMETASAIYNEAQSTDDSKSEADEEDKETTSENHFILLYIFI